MDSYSAVTTTGIYCRPGCPARPHVRNVRRFAVAATAEAHGFRACHRCRPYRTAPPVLTPASELVQHALHLITSCAAESDGGSAIAARLGVLEHELASSFIAELGVTPDEFIRSRRVHLARRLLDDTDLPLTKVAAASGIRSVKQLDKACRDIFRASAGELRVRRRRGDLTDPDNGLVLRLPFAGLLDWQSLMQYLAVRAVPGVEQVTDDEVYHRTIVVEGRSGAIELWRGGVDHLLLRVHLPHPVGLMGVIERVRRIAGLDVDPAGPARDLGADSRVGPLLAATPGIRPPGAWCGFEIGVRAILGQQVTVTGATTLAGRLVDRYGAITPQLGPLGLARTFPAPAVLADASLVEIGLPAARAEAIRAFAKAVAEDSIRLDRSVSLDRFVADIIAVRGLGPWTAHYLAFRLGEPDAFPASDLGLRRALSQGRPLTTGELHRAAEAWRPWRAHVAARLWMTTAPARRVHSRRRTAL